MKVITHIIILLIAVFGQLNLNAQTEASVSIDTNSILVGDQLNLELAFTCPADYEVEWPNPVDTIISEIEIIAKSKIDTTYSEDRSSVYLRHKKLWQSGQIKDYHTELTDIIREYISGKFNVHAHEFTSDEILTAINGTATNDEAKNKLSQTLLMADLVKFAKYQPLPLEHDSSLNNAIDFVKETIHVTTPEIEVEKSVEETETRDLPETIPEDQKVLETKDGKEVKDVQ